MAVRKNPTERAAELLAAAVDIATEGGISAVTRASVARKVGVTDALINRYYQGRNGLRWETLRVFGKARDAKAMADALAFGYARSDLQKLTTRECLQAAAAMG